MSAKPAGAGLPGWGLALVWAAACLLLATEPSAAQGSVDQSNDAPATTSYGCGSAGTSLFQSFTPAAGNLSAVMLHFRAGGGFPSAGTRFAVQIRTGSPTGGVVARAEAAVPGPRSAGADLRVVFALTAPAPLTPGVEYVIEQVSVTPAGTPAAPVASWLGGDGNPYGRGRAYGCAGTPIADRDYNFVTYAASAPVASPTPDWPPSVVCPQIVGLVPRAQIDRAVADPTHVPGYGQLRRSDLPPGPGNPPRERLSLRALSVPYHPLHNALVFRAGCP